MTGPIGLIHNPNATRNRDRPAPNHPRLVVREPYSSAEVPAALADFREAGCEVVAVNGGDGTVREVLSALPQVYGEKLPRLVVFAAGATDLIAADVGGGLLDEGLPRLIEALDQGRGEVRVRRPLKVLWQDGSGRTATGMFFGAAAFVRATELSHKIRARGVDRARRWGSTQGWAVGLTLAGVLGAALAGPTRRMWLGGRPMTVDGAAGPRFLFLATTLERLMMNLWPFWDTGAGGLKYLDIDAPPHKLFFAFGPAIKGRPRPWMKAAGYRSGGVEAMDVALEGRFVLDGEFYLPGPNGKLRLEAGPPVEFLVP
jgi:hypothetical protein